jgi:hypothetical protein
MDTMLPGKIQGMAPSEWAALVDKARTFLVGIAAERRTTTYAAMMDALGTDRFKLNYVLGDVTKNEMDAGRPALSALVLYVDKVKPGGGFTAWCQNNGWLAKDATDKEAYYYWLDQIVQCWTRWS